MYFSIEFRSLSLGCCGQVVAMPEEWIEARKRSREVFHCPNCGDTRVFTEKTREQQAREAAERRAAEAELEASEARTKATETSRRYNRMRNRIRNGVCPCCNRTFDNLARHMATKHPSFGKHKQLQALRHTFGLTQNDLADEIGVTSTYISRYENDREIPEWAQVSIEYWMESESQ